MKKGFTLVELLATITILGLLGLIVGMGITSAIQGTRKDSAETQKKNIIASARNWAADNIYTLPEEGNSIVISLHDLLAEGFMEGDEDNQVVDGFYTDANFANAFDFNNPITADTTVYAKISKVETTIPETTPEVNNGVKDETPKTGVQNYLGIAVLTILFSVIAIATINKKNIKG